MYLLQIPWLVVSNFRNMIWDTKRSKKIDIWHHLEFILHHARICSFGKRNGFAFPSSWVLPPLYPSRSSEAMCLCVCHTAVIAGTQAHQLFVLRPTGREVEEHMGWTRAVLWVEWVFRVTGWYSSAVLGNCRAPYSVGSEQSLSPGPIPSNGE